MFVSYLPGRLVSVCDKAALCVPVLPMLGCKCRSTHNMHNADNLKCGASLRYDENGDPHGVPLNRLMWLRVVFPLSHGPLSSLRAWVTYSVHMATSSPNGVCPSNSRPSTSNFTFSTVPEHSTVPQHAVNNMFHKGFPCSPAYTWRCITVLHNLPPMMATFQLFMTQPTTIDAHDLPS